MESSLPGGYPQSGEWYEKHSRPTTEKVWAEGLGMTMDTFQEVKSQVADFVNGFTKAELNFKGRQRDRSKKKAVVDLLCERIPELSNCPDKWRYQALGDIITIRRLSEERRAKLEATNSESRDGYNSPASNELTQVVKHGTTTNDIKMVNTDDYTPNPGQSSSGGTALPAMWIKLRTDGLQEDVNALNTDLLAFKDPIEGMSEMLDMDPSMARFKTTIHGRVLHIRSTASLENVLQMAASGSEEVIIIGYYPLRPTIVQTIERPSTFTQDITTRQSSRLPSEASTINGPKRGPASPPPNAQTKKARIASPGPQALAIAVPDTQTPPKDKFDEPARNAETYIDGTKARVAVALAHARLSEPVNTGIRSSNSNRGAGRSIECTHRANGSGNSKDSKPDEPDETNNPHIKAAVPPEQDSKPDEPDETNNPHIKAAVPPERGNARHGKKRNGRDTRYNTPRIGQAKNDDTGYVDTWESISKEVASVPESQFGLDGDERNQENKGNEDEEIDFMTTGDSNITQYSEKLFAESLQSLEGKLTHVQLNWLDLMAQYFPLINKAELASSDRVTIPNWGLSPSFKISPYQLQFACIASSRECGLCPGGTNADDPGAGKTIQLLTLFLMRYFHYRNRQEVEASRKAKNGLHLAEGAGPNDACPSAYKQPLACWCEPRNAHLYPSEVRPGVTILLTPIMAVQSFISDVDRMLRGGTLIKRPGAPKFVVSANVTSPPEDHSVTVLSDNDVQATCMEADWSDVEHYYAQKCNRIQKVNGKDRMGTWSNGRFRGPFASSPDASTTRAPARASDYMIITTRGSLASLCKKYCLSRSTVLQGTNQKTPPTRNDNKDLLMVGSFLWDEAHLDAGGEVIPRFIKYSRSVYKNAGLSTVPTMWGATGTPDSSDPMRIFKCLVEALYIPEWSTGYADGNSEDGNSNTGNSKSKAHASVEDAAQDDTATYDPRKEEQWRIDILKSLDLEEVNEMSRQYKALCEKAKVDPATAAKHPSSQEVIEFIRRVVPLFRIRRRSTTKWYDHKPLIPKTTILKKQVLRCIGDMEETAYIKEAEANVRTECQRLYQEALNDWKARGSPPGQKPQEPKLSSAGKYYKSRVAASIPQLVNYWEAISIDPINPTSNDPIANDWISMPLSIGFGRAIDDSRVARCAKMLTLLRICEEVRHKKTSTSPKIPCKILVTATLPLVVATCVRVLSDKYGTSSVISYTAGMSPKDRTAAMDKFNVDDKAWIMVCSLRSLGVGVNLQRASYSVMVETTFQEAEVTQWFARIDRLGQTEPICHGYILRNKASNVDLRMVRISAFGGLHDTIYQDTEARDEDDRK